MRWPTIQVGDQPGQLLPSVRIDDQRHGHIGGVFGQYFWRVGYRNAARMRRGDVDIVDAVAEIGDHAQLAVGILEDLLGNHVVDGGHQHVSGADRIRDLLRSHRRIVEVQPRVEQLTHPGLDRVRQLAGNDDERFFLDRHALLS
jgi:hypothetical protein